MLLFPIFGLNCRVFFVPKANITFLARWVKIAEFENHLVFYLPRPDGVSIVRVLHAARDWWSLLGLVD